MWERLEDLLRLVMWWSFGFQSQWLGLRTIVESRICWLIRFEKISIISKKRLSTWSGHKRHELMEIDRGEENQNVLQSLGLKIKILKVQGWKVNLCDSLRTKMKLYSKMKVLEWRVCRNYQCPWCVQFVNWTMKL